ncbi:MAG: prepilin-type N-terminal cleavage/methylation domain-containing protein [Verrucomicrobiota bacterium]
MNRSNRAAAGRGGFTLAEVVTAIAIVAVIFGGMIVAYTQAARRAQWSGYSLAATALGIQQVEQAKSSRWDPCVNYPSGTNEIMSLNLISSNYTMTSTGWRLSGYTWTNLDLPTSGSNFVRATNFVSVQMVTNNSDISPAQLCMVRVDTVWPFLTGNAGNSNRLFTNTIITYIGPDNRDPTTLWN